MSIALPAAVADSMPTYPPSVTNWRISVALVPCTWGVAWYV